MLRHQLQAYRWGQRASDGTHKRGMAQLTHSAFARWKNFPSDSTNFIAEAIQQTPERTLIRRGNSSAEQTSFVTEFSTKPIPDSIKPKKMPVISASIVCSPDFETDKESGEKIDLGTTTKSVKYSVFVPMLIKAIQEQQAQIEELKAKILSL